MSTLVVKFILFGYCFSIRKQSSQVQVLWEDHRNDLWVNSFGALFLAVHCSLLNQCHRRCPYVLWRQQASLVFVSYFWRFFEFFGLSRNNQILTLWAVLLYVLMLLQV